MGRIGVLPAGRRGIQQASGAGGIDPEAGVPCGTDGDLLLRRAGIAREGGKVVPIVQAAELKAVADDVAELRLLRGGVPIGGGIAKPHADAVRGQMHRAAHLGQGPAAVVVGQLREAVGAQGVVSVAVERHDPVAAHGALARQPAVEGGGGVVDINRAGGEDGSAGRGQQKRCKNECKESFFHKNHLLTHKITDAIMQKYSTIIKEDFKKARIFIRRCDFFLFGAAQLLSDSGAARPAASGSGRELFPCFPWTGGIEAA